MSKDEDASGRMSRRTTIKTGIVIGAAAMAGRPGTAAAAAAPANPVVPVPIPAQVPAKEGIATLSGARIGYWDTEGAGQPIVLVHPATGSARIWVYQQPVFARAGYRVIAFSRRGYANSDAVPTANAGSASVDLHNLVEFLRIQKFHIVGSAAGGQISIDYALSHPDRLYSLTLACAVGGVTDRNTPTWPRAFFQRARPTCRPSFRELSRVPADESEGTNRGRLETARSPEPLRAANVNQITFSSRDE